MLRNEVLGVAAGALDTQHVELALDIAEYEIGSGHGNNPRAMVTARRIRKQSDWT